MIVHDERTVFGAWTVTDYGITSDTMKIVLEIAKSIALSDGNMSAEEERLICDLPNHVSILDGKVSCAQASADSMLSLKELVASLPGQNERCFAARAAYLVAAVARQPRDRQYINPEERCLYEELIEELRLPADQLAEIEESAKKELQQNRTPIRILMDSIFGEEGLPDLIVEKLYYAEGRHHPDHPQHGSYAGLRS